MRACCSFLWIVAVLLMAWAAAGCGRPAVGRRPQVVGTSVGEARQRVSVTAGVTVELDAEVDAQTVDEASLLLVRGGVDEPLLRALERPPLGQAVLERLVRGRVEAVGTRMRLVPLGPLMPTALHTLVVTKRVRAHGLGLERPFVLSFTTGEIEEGAPILGLDEPADSDGAVVRNLRRVRVHFSRPVTLPDMGGVFLASARGRIGGRVSVGACPTCYVLELEETLDAQTKYAVYAEAAVHDDRGRPVFMAEPAPGFMTSGELRTTAPAASSLAVEASASCVVVRWQTDVAADATLCLDDGRCAVSAMRQVDHELGLEVLDPMSAPRWFTLAGQDESTAPPLALGPAVLPPRSPRTLLVTEVLSRPRGAWPAQQFVELWNYGDVAVPLGGLELHDEGGISVLPPVDVPPGGRAVVVPSGFSLNDGADPPVPPETTVVRLLHGYIGGHGIRADGEALRLVEADGRLVSAFSTRGLVLGRGQSAVRAARCDTSGAYRPSPDGSSSPGAP